MSVRKTSYYKLVTVSQLLTVIDIRFRAMFPDSKIASKYLYREKNSIQ